MTLFRADRPNQGLWEWYAARQRRCIDQITDLAKGLLAGGHDAIVEFGLVQRENRMAYFPRIAAMNIPYVIHVLGAPISERSACA